MILYHHTCEHAAEQIAESGYLVPLRQLVLGRDLIWLTDQREADSQALGLTSKLLDCDRTAVCYQIETEDATPWPVWADANGVPDAALVLLETGRKPETWWVAETPQAATLL